MPMADAGPGRQARRGDEAFDDARDEEHQGQADRPCPGRRGPPRRGPCGGMRGPGSMTVQPRRRPVPAATKTAVSSSRPCGRTRPRKVSRRPAEDIRPMPTPRLSMFRKRIQSTGGRGRRPGPGTSRRPGRCSSRPGRRRRPRGGWSSTSRTRRRGGSARAVRSGAAIAAWTSGWVPIHQPRRAATAWRGARWGPTSGGSGRPPRGSPCVRKRVDVAPGGPAGACHGAARAGHELGEAAGEQGVGGARLDQGEMGGGALVEGDEFVGLGAGEPAPAAQQVRPGGPTRHGGRTRRRRGPWAAAAPGLGCVRCQLVATAARCGLSLADWRFRGREVREGRRA